MKLFWRNSQCVKLIGCFRRGAPSFMFDGILNVSLSEAVPTTEITQENLELSVPPDFLDSHQTQKE